MCLLLCPSVLAAVRRRTLGGGVLRFLPVVVAAGYPFAMVASLSSGSSEVGERTTTFIFFGMAIVVGAWLAARLAVRRGRLERVATVLVATLCFLGGMIYGSGPDVTYVPGPYLVGANQRSVSAPSLAVAEWASTHLPAGSNVAADRQNGALLADVAHVNMVISIGGFTSASPLFFTTHFDLNDVRIIRQDDISYVVIDRRLASSLPLFGSYLEPGEATPGTRLTLAELSKFDDVAGVTRVYDNGPIQVYDVTALLGPAAAARPTGGNVGDAADATNAVVLPAALATAALLLFVRLRRRRRRVARADRAVVRWMVGALAAGCVVTCLVVPLHVSLTLIGLAGLAAVVVVVLLATRSVPTDDAAPRHDDRPAQLDLRHPRRDERSGCAPVPGSCCWPSASSSPPSPTAMNGARPTSWGSGSSPRDRPSSPPNWRRPRAVPGSWSSGTTASSCCAGWRPPRRRRRSSFRPRPGGGTVKFLLLVPGSALAVWSS